MVTALIRENANIDDAVSVTAAEAGAAGLPRRVLANHGLKPEVRLAVGLHESAQIGVGHGVVSREASGFLRNGRHDDRPMNLRVVEVVLHARFEGITEIVDVSGGLDVVDSKELMRLRRFVEHGVHGAAAAQNGSGGNESQRGFDIHGDSPKCVGANGWIFSHIKL